MSTTEAPVVSAPHKLSKRFFPLSRADKAVGLILLGWTLALNYRFGSPGAIVGVLILLVALWSLDWGKTYDRLFTRAIDGSIAVVDEGAIWQNDALLKQINKYDKPSLWRRGLQAIIRRGDPYPIRVDSMDDEQYGQVGLGYNRFERTDSVVFLGDGSNISRKDGGTQAAMLANLAGAVRRLSHGLNASVTFIARPRPADEAEFNEAINWSHHPNAVIPEASVRRLEAFNGEEIPDPEELFEQRLITREQLRWYRLHNLAIADPREEYLANGRAIDFAVVVTVPRDPKATKAARRWRPQPLDSSEVRSLPLTRTLKSANTALRNLGVEGLHLLNKAEVEVFCAEWRPFDVPEGAESGVSNHHPQFGVYGSHNAIEEDGVINTTFKVVEMPTQLTSTSISELFTMTTPAVTLAVRGENTRGRKEGTSLFWLTSIFDGLTGDMNLGKSIQKSRADLDDVSETIAATRDLQQMTILVRLTNLDPDQHADDSDTIVREAAGMGFILEAAPGATLQYRAALTAKTGMVSI